MINSETARNGFHGIRITESKNITLNNNLVEGNDRNGIALTFQMDGSRNIQVRKNTIQNNGDKGLTFAEGVDTKVKDNKRHDNGH